jgi:hypothetical protein
MLLKEFGGLMTIQEKITEEYLRFNWSREYSDGKEFIYKTKSLWTSGQISSLIRMDSYQDMDKTDSTNLHGTELIMETTLQ